MHTLRGRYFWVWLLIAAGLLIGCSSNGTPPGANSIGGAVGESIYSYHYWEEGLGILLWHDFSYGSESCSGTGSTDDPVYKLECTVQAQDGRRFEWEVHTADGVTAELWIEGDSFDLSRGALFLISSQDDGIEVDQINRDFSEIVTDNETIAAVANSDPDVANFIDGIEPGVDPEDVGNKDGLVEFTEDLQLDAQSVGFAGQVDQSFFSVPGQIVLVNGEEVQVFEFPDSTSAKTEAAQISADASSVGTSMMSWVATPHFYTHDRLIVLYVGENSTTISALNRALGEPIAQGQVALLPPVVESTTESPPNAEDLLKTLPDALANNNYDTIEQMMGDPFIIGYWQSESQGLSPAESIEELRSNLLLDPSQLTFTVDPSKFPDFGDYDPMEFLGTDGQGVDIIYSQGWGADSMGEAILLIGLKEDGTQYWPGMIYSFHGFSEMVDRPLPIPVPSYEATVYRNEANSFEFDYPTSWSFEEERLGVRASGAQFFSEGEFVFSAIVYLWDPKNDLNAYIDIRRQGWSSSSTVVTEEELNLVGGYRAVQFEIQGPDGSRAYSLLTEVGENYLELFGTGELELFAEIGQTLRPSETTSIDPVEELATFENQVATAISSKDLVQMQTLMDETFGFAFWGSEGYSATPEEAIAHLQQNYLSSDQTINFNIDPPDLSDIIGSPTVLSIWDPAQNPVKAMFSSGWGPDGQDEAFLILIQRPDGSYAWDGIILAGGSHGGFAGLYDSTG